VCETAQRSERIIFLSNPPIITVTGPFVARCIWVNRPTVMGNNTEKGLLEGSPFSEFGYRQRRIDLISKLFAAINQTQCWSHMSDGRRIRVPACLKPAVGFPKVMQRCVDSKPIHP